MEQHGKSKFHRRGFLSVFWTGVSATAASFAPAVTAGVTAEPEDPHRKSQYRETDHVKTYYEVNRS